MKPKVLVTREVFQEVLDFLSMHFEVSANQSDLPMGAETPAQALADKHGALTTLTARRMTESEVWLRAGQWSGWKHKQFLGTDVHRATLGILGICDHPSACGCRICCTSKQQQGASINLSHRPFDRLGIN